MRAVFLVLLSANLLFLAWARWIDTPQEAVSQDALLRLPRLKLVTESPAGPQPVSGNPASANPAAVDGAARDTGPMGAGTTGAAARDGAAADSVASERVSLRLPDSPQACKSIGPFNDITSAARAAGLLTQRGFRLRQRAEEGETIEGYWVFVGGMQSDDDVNEVVNRLGKSGLSDAHVMKSYSTSRRVSVGMFSTRERAEKRAAAVRKMGLQPEIGERRFPGTVYWVDVALGRGPDGQQLPPEDSFADIGHPKVQTQPCPPGLRPDEPQRRSPARDDEGDGVTRALPRTTVASAPKLP